MKNTKIMIAVVAAFVITWLLIGSLAYFLSDLQYKEALTQPGLLVFMFIFGWIPAVIVGSDLEQSYE